MAKSSQALPAAGSRVVVGIIDFDTLTLLMLAANRSLHIDGMGRSRYWPWADIAGARADQRPALVLFDRVRYPADGAAEHEQREG